MLLRERMRASRRNNYCCYCLRPPREPSTKDLEERVVVGPKKTREALLDLDRQPLVVVRPVDGPADALVERREGFGDLLTWAPGTIGMGNCLRTRVWSAGDAFRAPPGSRTLAPFFRPTAQTGALFARAVVCATVTSSARVLSMVLVASRGRVGRV